MAVAVGHPDAVRRIALEVEFDDDRRLVADDPAIVPRLDRDDRRRGVLAHAAVREADVDAAARKETDMELKRDLVRRISDMAPKNKVAADYLMEVLK